MQQPPLTGRSKVEIINVAVLWSNLLGTIVNGLILTNIG